MNTLARCLLAALAATTLSACDKGTVSVDLTDAPVDEATLIQIQFDGIELLRADGTIETFDFPAPGKQIDVLDLQNGRVVALLDKGEVTEGDYSGVRLKVSAGHAAEDSFITLDASPPDTRALFLPEERRSRLTLTGARDSFRVTKQEDLRLTIDFDLRRSVLAPTGTATEYTLLPTLRLVKNAEAGEITGQVAEDTINADPDCVPAVYLFSGSGVTPNDAGSGDTTSPLTSAKVDPVARTYRLTFLPAGNYTAAFTCDAGVDDPALDEDLTFSTPQNATVTAGRTTADVDF